MKSGVLQAPLSSKRGTVENLKGQESDNPLAVPFRDDQPCNLLTFVTFSSANVAFCHSDHGVARFFKCDMFPRQ
jgi:hypothetical protein